MIVQLLFLSICVLFGAQSSNAAEVADREIRNTQLSYDLDAALLFSDSLKGLSRTGMLAPPTDSGQLADSPTTTSDGGYRTLGIRHVKLGLEWLTPRRLKAFVLIRPDAMGSQGTIRREVDTRSGETSTPASDINFLDLYELTIIRPGVNASVGVRDRLVPEWKAYRDILEFGLEPRDPRKSFGAFLDLPRLWTTDNDGALRLQLSLVGSSNERHNGRSRNLETNDTAPSRSSPYWGGVVSSVFQTGSSLELGGGAAVSEEPAGDGKVTHTFYEAGIVRKLDLSRQSVKVGMDARQSRDVFKVKTGSYSDLQGTSAAVTAAIDVTQSDTILTAVRVGTGSYQPVTDTSKSLPGRGLQAELGYRSWLDDGMEATLLVTREWRRDQEVAGGQVGGFGVDPDRRSTISRFALQVAYRTGGSP